MSSFEISILINEIRSQVIGLKVDKIYHYPPDEIRFKLRGERRMDLVIEAGVRFHPTSFPKESPRFPSSFAMLLRKHLEGAKLVDVEQHDFDRIVILSFQREKRKHVVAELFSKGNVILLDENFRVIMPLKHNLKIGELYKFPESRANLAELRENDLKEILEKKEIVKTIAVRLGTGGVYAEEILERAGIDKSKRGDELSEDEISRIAEATRDLYSFKNVKPHIIVENGRYVDFQPVELLKYKDAEKKYFDSLYLAIDAFYSWKTAERFEADEKKSERVERLNARLKSQLEAKERFLREVETNRRIADYIYENYSRIEEIHSAFKAARESKKWEEIMRILEDQHKKGKLREIKRVIPEENAIEVELDRLTFKIWLDKSLPEIAEEYYNRAKKSKEKLDGVLRAIERTRDELRDAEKESKFLTGIRVARKRQWYEKYRWYITSEGFLVIGGRNAEMNEEIVSKHMEKNDLFFHTETPGGAATILKSGKKAGNASIMEACQFAGIYSALWKEGKHSGEVYYVSPEQVKRSARAGEYLPKGSFYIEGKRNYVSVVMKAGIGVDLENLRLMGGPVEGVRKHCDYLVVLEIGEIDFNKMSVIVAKKLVEMARSDEKHIVRGIATPDEVARFLPPGRSRIAEK